MTTKEGLVDLLYLQAFVVLYPAFDFKKYAGAPAKTGRFGTALAMAEPRYREYEYALFCVVRLQHYLDEKYEVKYDEGVEDEYKDFLELTEVCCA